MSRFNRIQQLSIIALVAFFGLNAFSSGRFAIPAAAWLAPVFGLYFVHSFGRRRTYLFLFLATWISLSIAWYGATPIWGPAYFIFMAVNAAIGTLPFVADWQLAPRLEANGRPNIAATLIFPATTTAIEYLTATTNPIGNFGAAGYAQAGFTSLLQLNAITGMLGLTFLTSWAAATVAWALRHGWAARRVQIGLGITAGVVVLTLSYGAVRLQQAPSLSDGAQVVVTGITVDSVDMPVMGTLFTDDPAAFSQTNRERHAAYLAQTAAAADAGAQIIVWPELAGLGTAADVAALLAEGQALADAYDIYLAMPTMTLFDGDRPNENVVHIAAPDGTIVLEHVKFGGNLIEGTLKGSGDLQTVETPFGTLSAVICWDTDFPATIRQAGQQGVDILLSPSYEWPGIDPMHAEMSGFRAIENGMTVVRQTDRGQSRVTDPYGRILATVDTGDSASLTVSVPTTGVPTVYATVGDLVGIVSLALTLALAGWALARGRSRAAAAAAEPTVTL